MENPIQIFKLLSDERRLKLLLALMEVDRQVCVCDLEYILNIPQYAVSRAMKDFRVLKLAEATRKGKNVYYQLNWPAGAFLGCLKKTLQKLSLSLEERLRLKELLTKKDWENHQHCEK